MLKFDEEKQLWFDPESDHMEMIDECRFHFCWVGIDENSIVLDLGAHVGGFSTYARDRGCKYVFAVEPNPESYQVLLKNTFVRDIGTVIPIHAACVNTNETEVELHLVTDRPCLATLVPEEAGFKKIVTVPTYKWDELLETNPTVIKANIQGYEYELPFDNMPDCVQYLAIEMHLFTLDWKRKAKKLRKALLKQFTCVYELTDDRTTHFVFKRKE